MSAAACTTVKTRAYCRGGADARSKASEGGRTAKASPMCRDAPVGHHPFTASKALGQQCSPEGAGTSLEQGEANYLLCSFVYMSTNGGACKCCLAATYVSATYTALLAGIPGLAHNSNNTIMQQNHCCAGCRQCRQGSRTLTGCLGAAAPMHPSLEAAQWT